MAETTNIAWCRHSWSPWIGCTALSAACDHCYAQALVERWGGDFGTRRRTTPSYWRQLARWNRAAADAGERRSVFPSMCDPFDNQVPETWREDMFERIRECPSLDFLLLTKRPQNIRRMLPRDWYYGYRNVRLGVTCENQEEADRRIPHLLAVPAMVRFLSCEPLLSALDLTQVRMPDEGRCSVFLNALTGRLTATDRATSETVSTAQPQVVSWAIVGGESGPGARPMRPEWARDLLRQCREAGTAAFFKQVGSNRDGWPPGITGKGDDPAQWPEEFRVQEMPHG